MVDLDRVTARLSDLEHRVARVRARQPDSVQSLERDEDLRDLLAFNLFVAVQCCLDIASHLIADEGWRPATSLADAFQRLGEHSVLTDTTVRGMYASAGFRNVVAHGYAGIDLAKLHAAATGGVDDLEAFARDVARWLATR